ncbi:SnoaL-like polyketide cyclase [Murinocardiopsis flavida]|uniref:SnoaL-like polyketide cyclase n=1 Tax=Murinocardiopsis flavida TaxID=645275 RepID=A0A2P8CEY9_9ACTN|nr:ester cyclase [Murinocardiopsis flavida]PSK83563.1 SnoaL-like polyketide cyclase [Murinocardiopsis flavida]
MTDPAIALYTRFIEELWHAPDDRLESIAAELAAPGMVVHQDRTDGQESDRTGPGALVEIVRSGRGPFSNVRVDLDVPPVGGGDVVAGRWTFSGVYEGGIPGAGAAPGTPFTFGGLDLFRVADGRLTEYWVTSDTAALVTQLKLDLPA